MHARTFDRSTALLSSSDKKSRIAESTFVFDQDIKVMMTLHRSNGHGFSGPIFHPNPLYRSDFFILRLPTSINGHPSKVIKTGTQTVVSFPDLEVSIELSTIVQEVCFVLARNEEFDIRIVRAHHDTNFPLLSVEFPPQKVLENITQILSKSQAISSQISSAFSSLLKSRHTTKVEFHLEVELELYLCSPNNDNKKLRQVTSKNARFHVDAYEGNVMFDFPSLMKHTIDGTKYRPEKVDNPKLADLLRELTQAADEWFSLGVFLGVPPYKLLIWRKQYNMNPNECLTDMLVWLVNNEQVTWVKVVEALCSVEKKSLARGVCFRYGVTFPANKKVPNGTASIEATMMKISDVKASSEAMLGGIKTIIENEYPALEERIGELTKQKEELQKKLERERKECEHLWEYRKEAIESDRQREELDGKICDLKDMIQAKEESVKELQRKLELSEHEYLTTRQQIETLMKELSHRTCELEKKSTALQILEETLLQSNIVPQAEMRMREEEIRRTLNRSLSQNDYIAEIEFQHMIEEQKIQNLNVEIEKLENDISTLESRISSISRKLRLMQNKSPLSPLKSTKHSELDDKSERLIEQQIAIAKCNIDLVDMRSEFTLQTMKLKSLRQELQQSKINLKKKTNLLPDMGKCFLEGLSSPVCKMNVNSPLEFKVHLLDRDGHPCSGEHVVTAYATAGNDRQPVDAQSDELHPNVFTLTYVPSRCDDHLVFVSINDVPLSSNPHKLFVVNIPHLPSCTVCGEGAVRAKKNRVATVRVHLVDSDGNPINTEQVICASLLNEEMNCLILPPVVKSTQSPGVYELSYLPCCSGKFALSVLVNGMPITTSIPVIVEKSCFSPLTGAAYDGHLEFIQKLLDIGVNTNSRDGYGDTALHNASRNDHLDAVEFLVEKGADVNSSNKQSRTPLLLAAWNGHTSIVHTLEEKGADVNTSDRRSRTPLMFAAYNGHTSTAQTLSKKGANMKAEDKLGETALHDAARNGHMDTIVTLLKEGALVNSPSHDLLTPLMLAAGNGKASSVLTLIENGAEVNVKDADSRTPLLFAAENNHTSTVLVLVEKGADVNAKNYKGNTALHIASGSGHVNTSQNGHVDTMELLIRKGAHVNSRNVLLETPLMLSVRHPLLSTVQTLVHNGADLAAKNWLSLTAVDYAREHGRDGHVLYLESCNKPTCTV